MQMVWRNVLLLLFYHFIAFQGIYYIVTLTLNWKTLIWGYFLIVCASQGVTAGVHRLWSHKAYKARLPLRVLLCMFQTMAFQNSIIAWARDHRVHHKYTDTDADPYNATRGFFFSHVGWAMLRKHPQVTIKGKTIDISDLESDPMLMFQKKYYLILGPLFCFVIPSLIPWYFWDENFYVSFSTAGMLRHVYGLHAIFLVNSAAHMWGTRPYDKHITPSENYSVAKLSFGEGWHNYHHVFPWDYKAAELNNYDGNFTTAFIDFMAKIGWAYDLRTVTPEMVQNRIQRTGTIID